MSAAPCRLELAYRYSHAPLRWGVYHASELQYLFGVQYPYLLGASDYTAAEHMLMRSVQRMWTRIARGVTNASTTPSPTMQQHTGQGNADGALAWPVFSVVEPWVLQLEALSEAGDLKERPLVVVEASGNGSAARCRFWGQVADYYDRGIPGAPHNGPIDGGFNDGVVVLATVLIALLVCCFMGTTLRRKVLKSGSYESLQTTDTLSDQIQASAGTSKTDDKLGASP